MTSAMERAVEAGARAASPHAFNDEFWMARGAPDHHQRHARENARNHAVAVLRAAFPILAEELVEIADELNHAAIAAGIAAHSKPNQHFNIGRSDAAIDIARRIRARIQQMAEAL